MIRVHEVQVDRRNVPLALQAGEAAIDAALAVAWTQRERSRDVTWNWATVGGYDVDKDHGLRALLQHYETDGRWASAVVADAGGTTRWTLRFARE